MKRYRINKLLLVLLFVAAAFSAVAQTDKAKSDPVVNVFVVVSEEIENAFVDAAKALKSEEKLEGFPLQGKQVHCTMYMTKYPAERKEEILAKVAEYAKVHCVFDINTTGLDITAGNWFFMNLERNFGLQHLANGLVEILSPMRAKEDFIPNWAKKFPNKVKYIKKFGSPNVYEEFNPHLTMLSGSDNEKLVRFCKNHEKSKFSQPVAGKIIAIGVGLAGKAGQIDEVWKIFPLQKIAE